MPQPLSIIIVDKLGELKTLNVKDYKEDELYKKCGFKKADDFLLQVEWPVKLEGNKYIVSLYGKLEGKAGMENKYDFPPPVDKQLYFGSCALVCFLKEDNKNVLTNLTLDLWKKIYEKLFGGFEDLTLTCCEDDDEEDELKAVPKNMKTKKGGYLKDGFVVDSDAEEEEITESEDEEISVNGPTDESGEFDEEDVALELGSELTEESYDYSDDEKNN
jgi:hypothetical protein